MATDSVARALALSASGGGEPSAYLKSASSSGNTLTITKKDDTTITYTPDLSSKQDVLTAGSNITISDNVISAAKGADHFDFTISYDEDSNTWVLEDGITIANVKQAVEAGKQVLCHVNWGNHEEGWNHKSLEDKYLEEKYFTWVECNEFYLTGANISIRTGTYYIQFGAPLVRGSGIMQIEDEVEEGEEQTYTYRDYWANLKISITLSHDNGIFSIDVSGDEMPADVVSNQSPGTILQTNAEYMQEGIVFPIASEDEAGKVLGVNSDGEWELVSGGGSSYTAGSNVQINNNVISATDTTYTAGQNITIENGVISATDTTYTAGTGIDISNNVISSTTTFLLSGTTLVIVTS